MFDLYDSKAHGSSYESKDRTTKVKVNAIGFMDNVRTSINAFESNQISVQQLAAMASRDSLLWHDILSTSNQALELPKCGYRAIIFEFEPTGEPKMIENPDCRLTPQDNKGPPIDIEKWKTSQATKCLGALKHWQIKHNKIKP